MFQLHDASRNGDPVDATVPNKSAEAKFGSRGTARLNVILRTRAIAWQRDRTAELDWRAAGLIWWLGMPLTHAANMPSAEADHRVQHT